MTSPQHANHQAIPDLDDEVRARVECSLREATALIRNVLTANDDSRSDEDVNPPPVCQIKGLKSGKVQTADTTLLKTITCPK